MGKKKGIPKRHPKPICALTKQAYMTNRHNHQESFMTNRVWYNPLEFPPLHWVSTQFVTGLRMRSANWHSRPCTPTCACQAHTTRRAPNRAEFLLSNPREDLLRNGMINGGLLRFWSIGAPLVTFLVCWGCWPLFGSPFWSAGAVGLFLLVCWGCGLLRL